MRLQLYLPDLDNARAALDWACSASGDGLLHVALAGALAWIWVDAGLRPEGFRRTRAAIAAIGPDTAPRLEARLRAAWPWLAHPSVGPEELGSIARAVDIHRQLGDERSLFVALSIQARFLPYCGQLDQAESALQEAEGLLDPDWPIAVRAVWLNACANRRDVQGRFEEAMAVLELQRELAIAMNDKRLLQDGVPLAVGARALDVLLALAGRRDRVVPKSELLDLVWPDLVVEENNLPVQIGALRKLLGPQAIATIPGRGYRFTADLDGATVPAVSAPGPGAATNRPAARAALTNLPAELPPLYDREADLQALRSLIGAHRLVTVVGPPVSA